jgi:hypothetical protein
MHGQQNIMFNKIYRNEAKEQVVYKTLPFRDSFLPRIED